MADAKIILQVQGSPNASQSAGGGGSGGPSGMGPNTPGSQTPQPGGTQGPQPGGTQSQTQAPDDDLSAGQAAQSGLTAANAGMILGMSAATAGALGIAVGVVVLGFMALEEALEEATELLDELSGSLVDISGPVAAAQARAEMRELAMLLRRDEVTGGSLADYLEAQSELNTTLEDIKTQIGSVLAPIGTLIVRSLNEILRLAEMGVTSLAEIVKITSEQTDALLNAFQSILHGLGFGTLGAMVSAIRAALRGGGSDNLNMQHWNSILAMFGQMVEQHFPPGWSFP